MDLHHAFKIGALKLARDDFAYLDLHKQMGIEEFHWQLLTQREYWTPDQARAIRSILANVIEVSMTIAGMPAIPLPGQYVAAVIATCVAPCNRLVACTKAPDAFDAFDASGLTGTSEVTEMTPQQLMALVIAYSGGYDSEPPAHKVPHLVEDQVRKANESTKVKKL